MFRVVKKMRFGLVLAFLVVLVFPNSFGCDGLGSKNSTN